MSTVTVLSGGVGAARLLRGMIAAVPPESVTAIVNVGDDTELHGLCISPDLDTITYTLAEAINTETGWGLSGETWQAMEQVRHYADANGIGAQDPRGNDAAGWFALGDRVLGTHLYRTSRRLAGATLVGPSLVCAILDQFLTPLEQVNDLRCYDETAILRDATLYGHWLASFRYLTAMVAGQSALAEAARCRDRARE